MIRYGKPILLVLVVAVCSHLAVIQFLPSFIMSIAMQRIADGATETAAQMLDAGSVNRPEAYRAVIERAGWNSPIPAPRADHTQRYVVRSSADVLYSACVFDLADGPLRVTTPLTGGYTSISAFAANTDNFFVLDDRQSQGSKLSVVIHRRNQAIPSTVVEDVLAISPTVKGIVLVRYLIEDNEKIGEYVALQTAIACGPV